MSRLASLDRGIVLLAIGSKYYGQWAINMALSIRFYNDSLPIQLITDDKALQDYERYKFLFDIITKMKPEHIRRGKQFEPGRAKLLMYPYLAFEKNIYLDVDAICIKDLEPLFDECNKYYLTQTHDYVKKGDGLHKEMRWMNSDILWKDYAFDDDAVLPATNTSFQYIKKCSGAAHFYSTAVEALEHGYTAKDLKESGLTWGLTQAQPDELYINIACAKLKHDPGGVSPVYFTSRLRDDKPMKLDLIKQHYYVLGYWGDMRLNLKQVRDMYDPLNTRHWMRGMKMYPEFKLNRIIKTKFVGGKIR